MTENSTPLVPVYQAVRQKNGTVTVYEVYYRFDKPVMISKAPLVLAGTDLKDLLRKINRLFLDIKTNDVLEPRQELKATEGGS